MEEYIFYNSIKMCLIEFNRNVDLKLSSISLIVGRLVNQF